MRAKTYPTRAAVVTIDDFSFFEVALKHRNIPGMAHIRTFVGLRMHDAAAKLRESFKLVSGPLRIVALVTLSNLFGHGQ